MRRILRAAGVAVLAMSGPSVAQAEVIRCTLTDWRGADLDIARSWVGDRFEIDTRAQTIRIAEGTDWRSPMPISEINRNADFTAHVAYIQARSSAGNVMSLRYGMRVYSNGGAEAGMTVPGYYRISATGTCTR